MIGLRQSVSACATKSLLAAAFAASLAAHALACPQLDRLEPVPSDGQLSIIRGVAPDGAFAADDFLLALGNGNTYQLRRVKFRMISNFVLTPSNVNFRIYTDVSTGVVPPRPHPGQLVASAGNAIPEVRDIGVFAPSFRQYEITYAIPPGFITLSPDRWYWLSPYALGTTGTSNQAFVAINSTTPIVGQVVNKASGTSGSAGATVGTWTLTTDCCIPASDLSMLVQAVQIGRPSLTDFTCDFSIDVQDIFGFLSGWFARSPAADFDGRDGVGVADIFNFLSAWFARE